MMPFASAAFNYCHTTLESGTFDVMKCVTPTLTDLQIDRLPSPSKMCDFLAESKQLVLTQISEQKMNADDLTVHRDGTSKQGQKYYTAQLATSTTGGFPLVRLRLVHNSS